MTSIETLTFILILWSFLGGLALILIALESDYGANAHGFEILSPLYVYKNLKVNWFGACCVTLLLNSISPAITVCYWFYKLCTVGRR